MPMYEYACVNNHRVEDLRQFTRRKDPGPECPECGEATEFVISATKRQNYNLGAAWADKKGNLKEI